MVAEGCINRVLPGDRRDGKQRVALESEQRQGCSLSRSFPSDNQRRKTEGAKIFSSGWQSRNASSDCGERDLPLTAGNKADLFFKRVDAFAGEQPAKGFVREGGAKTNLLLGNRRPG